MPVKWWPLTMFSTSRERVKSKMGVLRKSYPEKQFKMESNVNKTQWRILFKK